MAALKTRYLTIWTFFHQKTKYYLTGDDTPVRSLLSHFKQREEGAFGKLPIKLGAFLKGWIMCLDTLEEFEMSLGSLGVKYFKIYPLAGSKKRLTDSVYGIVFAIVGEEERETKIIGMLNYDHPGKVGKLDKKHLKVSQMLGW